MGVESRRPPFPFLGSRGAADLSGTENRELRTENAAPGAAPFDHVLAATVLSLVAFGLVMIYSASHVLAERTYHSGTYFLSRQVIFAVLGTTAMIAVSYVPYRLYRLLAYPILLVGLAALAAVVGGAGQTIRGATRWIPIGPFNIEPSEIAKVAVVIWLCYSVAKKRELVKSFSIGFVPHVLLAGGAAFLCLLQPDFGSAMILVVLTFSILFVAGARISYLLGSVMLAVPVVWQLVAGSAYRTQRILSFLDPWKERFGAGYQLAQSQISFGAGGVLGKGIGEGQQKLLFLPDAHNDFISAIVGEELGLIGVLVLLAAVGVLLARGFRTATRCRDPFGSYLAFGITMLIGLQALINVGVAMGAFPTKGLTLPFVSYGGSSLLVQMAAVGILLNISRSAADPAGAAAGTGGGGTDGRTTGPGR
ncbi:MAG: putative lipid II flippase FtsW [Deltaproteobacteria bacterium]|nr:putative lipid II flippase FtsW [Deltaproteobacteria bacterium]